ncbi:MAG: methyltransferase [Candidatus Aminicenantes bacterium]|nr:methyltransferase [Candidatus Aminicenantes bacterium]NIM83603.1 methyltransferase [Candidatus Aminicenantes bacterium]NIN23007.1 methyltransferase [Candidatus Aminicenantes bacterium]NIN46744.1 methyltransferase [Candidatus Aminicenantes bacterium]NIN89650.1 methyltransferase [Candidatus Aminicenantes bacterium]
MEARRRQRVLDAMNHVQPDRVPIDFGSHRSSGINPETYRKLRQYLGLPDRPVKVYDMVQQLAIIDEDLWERFGSDTIELGYGFGLNQEDWKPWTLTDGTPCLIPAYIDVRRDGDDWVLYGGSPVVRPVGVQKPGMHFFDQTYWPYLEGIPDDLCNLSGAISDMMWAVPTPPNRSVVDDTAFIEGAKKLRESTDRAIIGLFGGSMFEIPQFLCRNDNFLVLMAAQPKRVFRLLEALVQVHLKNLEMFLGAVGAYIDIILFGDDLGMQTGPQISPDMYREFFKPYHAALWKRAKELADVKVMLHSCGGLRPLLDDLIDAGLDAANPIQTSCKGMEPGGLKCDFGDRLCFWGGGCDTQTILPKAAPGEVRRHVLERLEIFAPGGGFVFQQVHNILAGVPPENIVAMFDAVKEFNG